MKAIPDGYHTITPYLVIPRVAAVIEFLKQAFDAVEKHRSVEPNGRIKHVEMRIGDSNLMLGEPPEGHAIFAGMLYLYVIDADETYRRAVAAGAESISPPQDMSYGDRVGAVKDVAGNQWWFATHKTNVTDEDNDQNLASQK